ncbi:hypothetical protein KDW_54120 [Dictyobacter vulcani]|uniref:HTH tetR-type domain-containing protein n=1 Tax=Dictyobacter vulcani TaxID=2607529 RepID=A0A5J4KXG9_9CHLR|nr:TetR/AcrR family transcriptional regulator [Dictyobacter vulcani]GER91250.1 hypothetical protein KDW_54120 [Dictyobacter vulcani]
MERKPNTRVQQTRERLRNAAHRLFLQQGYLGTSTDAILAEAGVSSKETLYRHYATKEELFVDVLSHLTLKQPGFAAQFSTLPTAQDLPALRQALTRFAHEILIMMSQPDYLAMLRIIIAEQPRFPQLGAMFFSTVPQRGIAIIMDLLQGAREQQIIAEVDFDALARALLGGLLTYALTSLVFTGEQAQPPGLDRADALVEIVMRALTPP